MLILLTYHRLFIMVAHAHKMIDNSHQQIITALVVTAHLFLFVYDAS